MLFRERYKLSTQPTMFINYHGKRREEYLERTQIARHDLD